MVAFPPCKINLGLNIIRKRPDGYHDLQTCFYPVPWCDVLEIIPGKEFRFTSSGLPIEGTIDQNLCVKAYELMKTQHKLPPVHIHLHKIIPMGAGLGGGSSDAASTLTLLNSVFDLHLDEQQLARYAAKLGSDCAFFIRNEPMIGTGRGETLEPTKVSLAGYEITVVKPEVSVPTAEAYAEIKPRDISGNLKSILETVPMDKWKEFVVNDFEEKAFRKYPSLATIKQALYNKGAIYAAMSGSGSAVFGIFEKKIQLDGAFDGGTVFQTRL